MDPSETAVLQAALSCVCAASPQAAFLLVTLEIHELWFADTHGPTADGMALRQLYRLAIPFWSLLEAQPMSQALRSTSVGPVYKPASAAMGQSP
jgi:hypothetical protein